MASVMKNYFYLVLINIFKTDTQSLTPRLTPPIHTHTILKSRLCLATCFQGAEYGWGEKSNLEWISMFKHHLSQAIKANITSNKSCWWHRSLILCDKNDTLPLWFSFPKPITPVSSWEKHQTNLNWGTLFKTPDLKTDLQNPQNYQSQKENRKVWEAIIDQETKDKWTNAMWCPGLDPERESRH